MKLAYTFSILGNGRYCGMLFGYETECGLRWSHSILDHGSPLLATTADATHDFWETKLRLPAQVHRILFGE